MSEFNDIEETPKLVLDLKDYPMVYPVFNNDNGNNGSNNYKIASDILIGGNEEIVNTLKESITLTEKDLQEFGKGLEFLNNLYNLNAFYTYVEKEINRYAISRIEIPGKYNTVMNIFTGGVDITNGGSNVYLNSNNVITTENVETYHQAKFFRDCLVKYFEVMGIRFSI